MQTLPTPWPEPQHDTMPHAVQSSSKLHGSSVKNPVSPRPTPSECCYHGDPSPTWGVGVHFRVCCAGCCGCVSSWSDRSQQLLLHCLPHRSYQGGAGPSHLQSPEPHSPPGTLLSLPSVDDIKGKEVIMEPGLTLCLVSRYTQLSLSLIPRIDKFQTDVPAECISSLCVDQVEEVYGSHSWHFGSKLFSIDHL